MTTKSVGIWSVGVELPALIRTNDWWPKEIVARWSERVSGKLDRPPDGETELELEGARLVLEAMAELRDDPFKGSRERRVLPDGMLTSALERSAAERAISRAGIDKGAIDLVLSTTSLPDYLMVPNACRTHEDLGLSRSCFTLQTEGVCNAFHMQLSLAQAMIQAGRAKVALLIQSSGTTRLMSPEDPMSAWFGDGATAVIVGEVAPGFGILGQSHETHGEYYEGLVCGVPERPWYSGERPRAYIVRPELSRRLLLETIHRSHVLIGDALSQAGLAPDDIDFYAAHQGFAWLRKVTQKLAHLSRARWIDSFPWAASVLGANIPLIMATAEREGLLRPGDRVATFGGAAGSILSSMVLRWGRRVST